MSYKDSVVSCSYLNLLDVINQIWFPNDVEKHRKFFQRVCGYIPRLL